MLCQSNGQMLLDQAAKNHDQGKLLTLCTGKFQSFKRFEKSADFCSLSLIISILLK